MPTSYPNSLLDNYNNKKEIVQHLAEKFSINKVEDWYLVTDNMLREIIHLNLSHVMSIVKDFYPEINLSYFMFGNKLTHKTSQHMLWSFLIQLFPDHEIVIACKFDVHVVDYYIPLLKLGFNFQVTLVCL